MKLSKHIRRPILKVIDEVGFNLPQKNDWIRDELEKYQEKYPKVSTGAGIVGNIVSGVIPGGVVTKVLGKLGKIGKVINAPGIKGILAKGAIYGGAGTATEGIIKGKKYDELTPEIARSALAGGAMGGAFSKIPSAVRVMRNIGKSKTHKTKELIDEIRRETIEKIGKKGVKAAEKINATPTENSRINIDNLITRPTQSTERMVDALYQDSPSAAGIIDQLKNRLKDNQAGFFEDIIAKANKGKQPSLARFEEEINKKASKVTNRFYNKAYQTTNVDVSPRVKGSQDFKKYHKKTVKARNDLDVNDPTHAPESVRILDQTKRSMSDEYDRLAAKGLHTEKNRMAEALKGLDDNLNAASPHYQKGTDYAAYKAKALEQARKGTGFDKGSVADLKKTLTEMNVAGKKGYSEVALEKIMKDVRDKIQGAEFPQAGRGITNPDTAKRIREILGAGKGDELIGKAGRMNKAVETVRSIREGSPTHKRKLSTRFLIDVLGAARGKFRSLANIGTRIANAGRWASGDKIAKTQLRTLMRPDIIADMVKNEPKSAKISRIFRNQVSPVLGGYVGRRR
jgi:hypothetical protein